MLGSARFLGVFPDARDGIPAGVLATLSEQLDLQHSVALAGYFKGSRRIGHSSTQKARPRKALLVHQGNPTPHENGARLLTIHQF